MIKKLSSCVGLSVALGLLVACANQAADPVEADRHKDKPIKRVCSAPPPPQNIWKLEPMLKDKGLITEDMPKEQKEKVIRNYINKKNSAYLKCHKGK